MRDRACVGQGFLSMLWGLPNAGRACVGQGLVVNPTDNRVRGRACDGQGFYWRDQVALGDMLVVCSRLSDLAESDAFLDVLGVLVSW